MRETRSEKLGRRSCAARYERALLFESIARKLPNYYELRDASCVEKVLLKCVRACRHLKGLCATACEARSATVADGLCA